MVSRISFCLQIISIALFGGEYYFTYTFESKNIVAYKDKIVISKKMTVPTEKPNRFFTLLNEQNARNEREFVEKHKDDIILLLLQNRAFTKTDTKTASLTAQESAMLRTSPTLINVDFKEDFAIIGLYENQ